MKEIVDYISPCLIWQRIEVKHQRLDSLLHGLSIPKWKGEHVTMDFVTGLPRIYSGRNVIWVIIDRLTKTVYFLPIRTTDSTSKLACLYVDKIVRLHSVPSSIVSD